MALPAIRASGPEPIQLPDVRRLDQTQSWPAWLASRVESMKDECQPALADGKYREIATLPASLILGPAERAEVERHICDLDALCKQTPRRRRMGSGHSDPADQAHAGAAILATE